MVRECDFCGREFVAQRSTAKFCSSSCRARNASGVEKPVSAVVIPLRDAAGDSDAAGTLLTSVEERVRAAGLSSTPDGLAAVLLARALERNVDGSKLAALYGKFTVAMDRIDALAPKQGATDDLRLRRDRKRARTA